MTVKLVKFLLSIMGTLFITAASFAANPPLTCQITAVKSPLWSAYNVTITMKTLTNLSSGDVVLTLNLPQATDKTPSVNSVSKTFDCNKFQQFNFSATYTPAIWHSSDGQPTANTFNSFQIYNISNQVLYPTPGTSTLTITIKYPEDFGAKNDPSLIENPPN